MKFLAFVLAILLWLILLPIIAWAFGALWFDAGSFGHGCAFGFLVVGLCLVVFVPGKILKPIGVMGLCGLVFAWWVTLKPSQDRNWQPDVARTAWAEIDGDLATIHNVRNFDYLADGRVVERWETRQVRLSSLTGLDLAINYWGSEWIAHPLLSFQFSDAPPVCFSIEIRKESGESYSALAGLYRQYELIAIAADERDVVRLRTNYRPGETVYLYRTTLDAAAVRERFLEYLASLNLLHAKPLWYHAITTNCTTSIRAQHPGEHRNPWDWRMLLNGKMDKMFFEQGTLQTEGLPFRSLRSQALINSVAQAADRDPQFSKTIREGLAGFPPMARTPNPPQPH